MLLLVDQGGVCGDKPMEERSPAQPVLQWTGNLRVDFFGRGELHESPAVADQDQAVHALPHKSPWLAGGMSLLVPGAGEFYAESYWKAAAFLAVDVAVFLVAYHYDKQGNRQTDYFQNFANQHWSVVQYANYAEKNLTPSGHAPYLWLIPGTEGLPPWKRVNWAELHRMESDIGGYYSHQLPPYGEQQYYELIGKYPQFNQGWDDANLLLPSDYETIKANLTSEYSYYGGERGKANTYYERATTFVVVAIINHIISAIDAAWTAHAFNKNVQAEVGLQTIPAGEKVTQVPVVKVRVAF
jgi:hypothetical protein